jgi:hypothetical protein
MPCSIHPHRALLNNSVIGQQATAMVTTWMNVPNLPASA